MSSHVTPPPAVTTPSQPSVMHAIIAGLCASLVGIGLARFAYTPLIPSLIEAHWFAANDVMYLGAANLVGYLAGALSGRPMARRFSARWTLRLMMALASLAFVACAFPVSVLWFFLWRFVSGVAGGAIMVLAATSVLPFVPGARKGLASGAIFLGLGMGIAGSGTLVPLLLNLGLQQTWIGLGILSAVLTGLSWAGWPHLPAAPPVAAQGVAAKTPMAMKLLYAQYALMAVALVPMMVFLVDYVARGLQWGAHWGAMVWVVYGVGAILGPMVYGALADRFGFGTTSRVVLALQAVAIVLLALNHSVPALVVAVLVIGSFPPGIVPVNLGRIQHLLPGDLNAQNHAWSRATTAFALFQALAGYAYSYLYALSGGNYALLFWIGAGAVLLALLLDFIKPGRASIRDKLHTI